MIHRHHVTMLLISLTLSLPVAAKTLYVEQWGVSAAPCGSRTTPCRSISLAVSAATRNDRIMVGPGSYPGNLNLNHEGLVLESVAGPRTTNITSTSNGNMFDLVRILQRRIRVGRIGRGFTLTGAVGSTGASGVSVVSSDLDRIRIEGNIMLSNSIGAEIRGDHQSIRGNIFSGNDQQGIVFYAGGKLSIQGNRAIDNGSHGFEFIGITRSTIRDNLASYNHAYGFLFDDQSHNNRISDNAADRNSFTGMGISTVSGMKLLGNLVSQNGSNFSLNLASPPATGIKPLQLKNNLSSMAISGSAGFEFLNLTNAQVIGNTATDAPGVNNGHGFRFNPGSSAGKFIGNNSWANDAGCGISHLAGPDLVYRRHFFGDVSGPDPDEDSDDHDAACGLFATHSSHASKPNPVRVQRAARL